MASITEERLKEMEEEMNRFEEEISTVQPYMGMDESEMMENSRGQSKMIIGSNTYHQVQTRLANHDDEPPRPQRNFNVPFAGLPPPPPPPKTHQGPSRNIPDLALKPPPPPPLGDTSAPRPSFLPPQLRNRPPMPSTGRPQFPPQGMPPPRHPMGGPPRPPMGGPPMGGPPRPPMGGPPMGGPPPRGMPPPGYGPPGPPFGPNHGGPQGPPSGPPYGPPPNSPFAPRGMPPPRPPIVIDKPKVVYSAAPVRNIPVEPKPEVLIKPEPEPERKEVPTEITQGIEHNVAAESMEVNRQAAAAVAPFSVPIPGGSDMDMDPVKREKKEKKKKFIRTAAGQQWEDQTLGEWENDDFRIFCGDLGNEVTEEVLARAFARYPSFIKSRVVRDKRTNKTRGYGFVSFRDPNDFVRAMREMNGKYVGNRPIKLRKSSWKDRQQEIVRKKDKEKKRLGFR